MTNLRDLVKTLDVAKDKFDEGEVKEKNQNFVDKLKRLMKDYDDKY